MQKRSFTAGGFSPDRGKREEMACAIRANPAEPGRWGGRTRRQNGAVRWTAGRGGRTGRQNGAQNKAAEQGGKTDRQDETAGRSGRTVRQDGAARRSGKTEQQDGAAGRSGRKRGGGQSRVITADRSGGAARTNKKRARPSVPPVLAPGFQPPEAAGQRKSARRSGPASAKGQCTGSQYAVRTPGRVQYYSHGRR